MHPLDIVNQTKTDIVKIAEFQDDKKSPVTKIAHEIFRLFQAIGMASSVILTARLCFKPNTLGSKMTCIAFFILFHDAFVIAVNNQKGLATKISSQVQGAGNKIISAIKNTKRKIINDPSETLDHLSEAGKEISKPVPAYFLSKNTILSFVWNRILPKEGFTFS